MSEIAMPFSKAELLAELASRRLCARLEAEVIYRRGLEKAARRRDNQLQHVHSWTEKRTAAIDKVAAPAKGHRPLAPGRVVKKRENLRLYVAERLVAIEAEHAGALVTLAAACRAGGGIPNPAWGQPDSPSAQAGSLDLTLTPLESNFGRLATPARARARAAAHHARYAANSDGSAT